MKELENTSHHQSPEEITIHPLIGGIVGAFIGAVVGSVVTTALNNQKARKSLKDLIGNIANTIVEALKEANNKPHGLETVAKNTIEEKIDDLGKKYFH